MATRIESGRIQLDAPGGVPMERVVPQQVDFMPAAREAARVEATRADIYDRMSASVFGVAKGMVKKEALQFAAENQFTPEQIELAKNGMPSAIPGLGRMSADFTVFGEALAEAQSLKLAAAFEQTGLNDLVKIQDDVKNGVITAEQAQQKIANINKGLTNSLAKVDGSAAIKFNATFSVHGNAVLKSAYEAEAKRSKELNTIKLYDTVANYEKQLETVLTQTEYQTGIDSFGRTVAFNPVVEMMRQNLDQQTLAFGDASIRREIMERWDKKVTEAKIETVAAYVISDKALMNDPIGTREKIKSGQLNKMSGVMKDLLANNREAVVKILNVFDKQSVDEAAEIARQKDLQKKNNNQLLVQKYSQWLRETDPRRKRQLEADMIPLADTLGELDKFLKVDKGDNKGNPLLKSRLKDKIANGEITSPYQLHSYFERGQINAEQLDSLQSFIYTAGKPDITAATQKLRRYSGVGDTLSNTFDPKAAEFIKYQKLEDRYEALVTQERDRQNTLPPNKRTGIDYGGIADQVIKDFKATDVVTDRKNEAKAKLDKISQRIKKDFGRTIEITSKTSVEDLKKLKGKKEGDIIFDSPLFTKDELDRIQKQIDILKE